MLKFHSLTLKKKDFNGQLRRRINKDNWHKNKTKRKWQVFRKSIKLKFNNFNKI